jgi:hypothetical protein
MEDQGVGSSLADPLPQAGPADQSMCLTAARSGYEAQPPFCNQPNSWFSDP